MNGDFLSVDRSASTVKTESRKAVQSGTRLSLMVNLQETPPKRSVQSRDMVYNVMGLNTELGWGALESTDKDRLSPPPV